MHWSSFVLFYWMIWAWPNDVIRPRPLRPSTLSSSLCHGVPCYSCTGAKRRRKKLGRYLSCKERTVQGIDFELILTVKMETRLFGSQVPSICNYCVVSRKTLKCCEEFLRFLKTTLSLKFSKFCSESFHRHIDRRCCVQMS